MFVDFKNLMKIKFCWRLIFWIQTIKQTDKQSTYIDEECINLQINKKRRSINDLDLYLSNRYSHYF